jgi:hypothetical protein
MDVLLASAALVVLVIWFVGFWRFHEERRRHPPHH